MSYPKYSCMVSFGLYTLVQFVFSFLAAPYPRLSYIIQRRRLRTDAPRTRCGHDHNIIGLYIPYRISARTTAQFRFARCYMFPQTRRGACSVSAYLATIPDYPGYSRKIHLAPIFWLAKSSPSPPPTHTVYA